MRCVVAILWVSLASGQQSISVDSPYIGNGAVAPGSILELNFRGLTSDPDPSDYSVQVAGNSALILSVGESQLQFVLPPATPLGTVDVTLTINGTTFTPTQINVVHAAPALFGIHQNVSTGMPPSPNQLTSPAQPGDFIILWGTGLGDLSAASVTIDLAGKMIAPSYAGQAPGLPGVDQINFQVPAGAQVGCYVPVMLQAADVVSNWDAVAVSGSPGPCSHPLGLSVDQMKALDDGSTIEAGSILILSGLGLSLASPSPAPAYSRLATPEYSRFELASGLFGPFNAAAVYSLTGPQFPPSCDLDLTATAGEGVATNLPPPLPGSLTFTGPAGQQLTATARANGSNGSGYSVVLPLTGEVSSLDQLPDPFFAGGTWNVSATGDTVILPLQFSFVLPPEIHWTNADSLSTISRDSDVTVTWDPGGYSASDVMGVSLQGLGGSPIGVQCMVPAQNGSAVLPQSLLQRISPTVEGVLGLGLANAHSSFQAPFADGTSGVGVLTYSLGEAIQVTIQ